MDWIRWPSFSNGRHRLAAIGLVVVATIGAALVLGPLAIPGSVGHQSYLVSFSETERNGMGTEWVRYGTTVDLAFVVTDENVTWVEFGYMWGDDPGSPLQDPDVHIQLASPNGTRIFEGPLAKDTLYVWNTSLNALPDERVVEAASDAEAETLATQIVNSSLGSGLWNYTLTVSSVDSSPGRLGLGINVGFTQKVGVIVVGVARA